MKKRTFAEELKRGYDDLVRRGKLEKHLKDEKKKEDEEDKDGKYKADRKKQNSRR